MKKYRIFTVLFFAMMMAILPQSVFAEDKNRVIDDTGVLSDSELIQLNDLAREISDKYQLDAALLMTSEDIVYQFVDAYDNADTYYSGVEAYLRTAKDSLAMESSAEPPTESSVDSISEPVTDLARVSVGDQMPHFIDDMSLLTSEQADQLTKKLDEISERHQFDTVIAVVPSLDYRTAHLYAADFFEQNGFGFGDELDGAILLLAMEDRDFGFVSFGFGIEAFTPAGQEYLDKLFLPQLKQDKYYEAFMSYADGVDDFLVKAESGKPYDKGNIPLTTAEAVKYRTIAAAVSVAIALLIALIMTGYWKSQLKSVRKQQLANAYIREGSMALTSQRDVFMYRQVQKVRRVQNDSKGGGGSSGGTHRSSSKQSYTGHSGKF